jgi:hypothetical protein
MFRVTLTTDEPNLRTGPTLQVPLTHSALTNDAEVRSRVRAIIKFFIMKSPWLKNKNHP